MAIKIVDNKSHSVLGSVSHVPTPGTIVTICDQADGVADSYRVHRIESCHVHIQGRGNEPPLDVGYVVYCDFVGRERTLKSHPVLGYYVLDSVHEAI